MHRGARPTRRFGYGESLLWVPGWTILGASYGASIVQGEYFGLAAKLRQSAVRHEFDQRARACQHELHPDHLVVDPRPRLVHRVWRLTVVGPDRLAVAHHGKPTSTSTRTSGRLQPGWAISYLDANWLLPANFHYDVNTASRGVTLGAPFLPAGAANGFVSGNELFGDFTAVYKIGKWQIGPVAYFEAQTTADKPGGGGACTPVIRGYQSQIAVGGLVGYDFGPVAVQVWFDDAVQCQNAICGLDVWGRMTFKIWGPEAPKPRSLRTDHESVSTLPSRWRASEAPRFSRGLFCRWTGVAGIGLVLRADASMVAPYLRGDGFEARSRFHRSDLFHCDGS